MMAKAAPVTIAAHFGISEALARDVKQELAKDMNRTLVAMPGETFLDKQAIWFSVADIAEVWATELKVQHPWASSHELDRTCRVMAKAIDKDLITANVGAEDRKVIVNVPQLTRTISTSRFGEGSSFELRAGVTQETSLWSKRTRIGYIQEKIITGEQVNEARRSLFGLK